MANVDLKNVKKHFGTVEVIHGVSTKIKDGEFIVIVGPSGCGKSTLLRMVAGLENVSEGEISIGGKVVNDVEPMDRDIAMVFQNYALYPHMSVRQNMGYGLKIAKVPKAIIDEKVKTAAQLLQLDSYLDRRPRDLSGGQRQRVAMGRAIVREPAVFLFDEPLSNLDAKLRVEMRREIKKLHQKLGTTIVYVTHDQTEAMSLGTNIAIMDHGLIQQCDTPKNIYNKPESVFVADFIGSPSMNLIEGKLKKHDNNIIFMPNGSNDSIKIPVGNYSFKNKFENTELTTYLGIRPEHIYFDKINPDCFEIDLKSELLEYTGHEQIVTFNYLGQQVLGKFASTFDIEINKELKLNIDTSQISLFDKDSKKRI